MPVYNNPPEFDREELDFLHGYLVTGDMSQDEPSLDLYFAIVQKLDTWKFG